MEFISISAESIGLSYSSFGDFLTFILCIFFDILIFETYSKDKRQRKIFLTIINMIAFSCLAHMIFWNNINEVDGSIVITCIAYFIYCFTVQTALLIFSVYLLQILDVGKQCEKILNLISHVVFIVVTVLNLLSAWTKFGLTFNDSVEKIHITAISPIVVYIFYLLIYSTIMIQIYRSSMVRQIRHALIATIVFAILILGVETYLHGVSLITMTLVLPVASLVFLVHSNPYSVHSGTLGKSSLESFLKEIYKNDTLSMLVVRFDKALMELPQRLFKDIYPIALNNITGSNTFKIDTHTWVYCTKNRNNARVDILLNLLITEDYIQRLRKYDVNCKALTFKSINNSYKEIDDLQFLIDYHFDLMKQNEVLSIDNKQVKPLERANHILSQLKDIAQKMNKDDPRVLVYCQPVKNLKTGTFDTAEALMRLKLDRYGIVYPDEFIPLAEKYNLIHSLSVIILNKTCKALNSFKIRGYNIERISINFSIIELNEDTFVTDIRSTIEDNSMPFDRIAVELTESTNENDFNVVKSRVEQLKSLNMHLYLDDFGTGYSNFDRMLKLDLDIVKFDRALLLYAFKDPNGFYLVKSFSEIFHNMGYSVLFEGVEDEDMEKLCIEAGADYLQGYLYSKPVPIEELDSWLTKEVPTPKLEVIKSAGVKPHSFSCENVKKKPKKNTPTKKQPINNMKKAERSQPPTT